MSEHGVILGGGLMGRLLAHSLARRGLRVEVFEAQGPEAEGSAARVAAAMLAPLAESAITELSVVRMGQHSLSRWPQLLAELPASEAPVFFQREGTLIVWHRQDAAEARRFEGLLQRTQQALPTLPAARTVSGAQLGELEPALAQRFGQGLYLPGEGQLDNRQLLMALKQSLASQGVTVHWHHPLDLAQVPSADWVFDCRGLGSRAEGAPLRGVRGEVVRVHAPGVKLIRPTRLVHPRYPLYIAPKPNDMYVIGATEIESEDLSPMSVRSAMELLSAAYTVHPGFGEARIVELCTQARPTLPDNLPSLRVLGPRTVQINGLYRHGFMIAPALLDATLAWMDGAPATLAQQWPLKMEHTA